MPTKPKVWDVITPRDNWEYEMAHILYLHAGLLMTFSKRIKVQEKILGDYYDMSPEEIA